MTDKDNIRRITVLLPADLADKLEASRRDYTRKTGEGLPVSRAAVRAMREGLNRK